MLSPIWFAVTIGLEDYCVKMCPSSLQCYSSLCLSNVLSWLLIHQCVPHLETCGLTQGRCVCGALSGRRIANVFIARLLTSFSVDNQGSRPEWFEWRIQGQRSLSPPSEYCLPLLKKRTSEQRRLCFHPSAHPMELQWHSAAWHSAEFCVAASV